ncbi:MAG TPA: hypothetical protein VGP93_05290 [Polyangiaceae bacterium]|nr:hypothetical protein [Polyangiaceae bacterium]
MLDRRIWGLLVLALGTGVLPSACGGGDEITKVVTVGPEAGTGAPGVSCSQPTDCSEGLSCIRNVCVASDTDLALGNEGESCQSHQDCATDLSCIAGICTNPSTVEDAGVQLGSGQQGETCQTRSDCEAGLTCIGGTCSVEDFGLDPTEKRCTSVECQAPADCISNYATSCDGDFGYRYECETFGPDYYYCDLVRIYCTEANWSCTAGTCDYTGSCAAAVSPSYACPSGEGFCDLAADACVDCQEAIDCGGASQDCVDNECVSTCEEDRDCPLLWTCNTATHQCKDTGCTNNRECVAYTGHALATCGTDGVCATPCQSDAECDNPNNYNFRACVDNYCADVGCETDEECRIRSGNLGISLCLAP